MAAGDDSSVNAASPTGQIDTRLTTNNDQRQVIVLGNAGDAVVNMDVPTGALMVAETPQTLFVDPWAGSALDTTDRWSNVGAATLPTVATGNMTMPATVSSYFAIQSKATMPYNLGYQYFATAVQLEAAAAVGAGRFWGLGTYSASPTAGKLVTDGIGFEIDQATGNLLAVTYTAAGGRTTVATLTRPSDGAIHRYAFSFRPTAAYWFIDGVQVAVASVTWPNVAVQELPVLIVRQNAASFTGTPVFVDTAIAVGDTSRGGMQLSDGTHGSRKARISKSGHLAIGGTALTPTSLAIAAGNNAGVLGPMLVEDAGNVTFVAKNTVAASPWAGAPVLAFEQSDDNLNWAPLPVKRDDTGVTSTNHVLAANAASTSVMFDTSLEGPTYVRVRVPTGPTTNGMTLVGYPGTMLVEPSVGATLNPIASLPVGTTTGTTPALNGQVGRPVRLTSTAAFTTAQTAIAAPAAGTRIYVTGVSATNEGAALTVIRLFAGLTAPAAASASLVASNDVYDMALAASGGGASLPFSPTAPWPLPLATALGITASIATTWDVTISYYVAP